MKFVTLTSSFNLSNNSVTQKCLPTTTSSMNKEKITLIVGNRLQDSIKSSSLVKIEDCPLLIHQSSYFIYIILLSLQARIGNSVSPLLLWKRHWWKISKTSFHFVTNFIWSYLHQFFDDSHGLKASLKPLRRPFDRCQSRLEAINNGRDIKQINW